MAAEASEIDSALYVYRPFLRVPCPDGLEVYVKDETSPH
jgi:hypothetical protein